MTYHTIRVLSGWVSANAVRENATLELALEATKSRIAELEDQLLSVGSKTTRNQSNNLQAQRATFPDLRERLDLLRANPEGRSTLLEALWNNRSALTRGTAFKGQGLEMLSDLIAFGLLEIKYRGEYQFTTLGRRFIAWMLEEIAARRVDRPEEWIPVKDERRVSQKKTTHQNQKKVRTMSNQVSCSSL